MKQLILAGDVYQYRLYLLKKMLKEEDTVYVIAAVDLLGKGDIELATMIKVGTWYKREYGNIMPIRTYLLSKKIDFDQLAIGTI